MIVNYERKTFIVQATGLLSQNILQMKLISYHSKLECLPLSHFQPSLTLVGKVGSLTLEWSPVRGLHSKGRLLALPVRVLVTDCDNTF
jgi:hypothetical protein